MSTGLRSRSGPATAGRTPVDAVRWFGVRAAALIMAIAVMIAAGGFLLAREASGPTAAWARADGSDGLWVGHSWLDGRAGLSALTARIRKAGISDVYVQAGHLDAAGRLSPAQYAGAGTFLAALRAALPRVRVCAWIGGTVGAGRLNLDDAATRAGIVASASALLRAGFGGISYDLSPVASGDTGLLSLLTATKALHPAVLSVTAPKLEPLAGINLPAALILRRPTFWSTGYLTQVADRASQVAVLSFDTGMPFPSWYSGYVARETTLALHAVPARVGLVMGIPAFAGATLGHHGSAETVAAALRGVRAALTAGHHPRPGFGTGLYTAGSATVQDWSSYQSGWVRPSP